MARGRVEVCSEVGRLRGVREVRPRGCLGHQIWRNRGRQREAQCGGDRTDIAGLIHILRCKAVTAGRQGRRRKTPGPAGIRRRSADLRRAVEHLHRAVSLGRAGQAHDIAGRDRIAADHRRSRRLRVDRDGGYRRRDGRSARSRRHGEVVAAVSQRRGVIAPRSARGCRCGADLR